VEPAVQFGRNLRMERENRGLSQAELACAAGVHMSEVSRLEWARRDPRLSTIVKLARALEVSPSRLLDKLT
jgi:transcriptional regulator with XRE-family HTH domain